MTRDRLPLWFRLPLGLLAGLAILVAFTLVFYRPDWPIATIEPGSSAGPAFVVQIIRPRLGLPVGGLLPPQLFGLERHLGFDSTSDGATVSSLHPERLELKTDGWHVVVARDDDGQVSQGTEVSFELTFRERGLAVRCRPGEPTVGSFDTTRLPSGELSGHFDIELAQCERRDTGKSLGWPSKPLVLRGSFDRLTSEERMGLNDGRSGERDPRRES